MICLFSGLNYKQRSEEIYHDDGLGEDISDHVQQVRGLSALDIEGVNDELSNLIQITRRHLQRQQHQHWQPVEEVVHRGTSKSPAGWEN